MDWMHDVWGDLRFASRQLRRSPGFTVVAALTIALGIGANSAIFALVDATLLRPLPLPDPDRLVMIWEKSEATERGLVAPLNLADWREQTRSFDGLAGYFPGVGGMVMASADGTTEDVARQWLPSANIFDVLGIRAIAGRTFLPADEATRLNVIVLSESFWRTRFNADRSLIGRDIRLDGAPFTVIGVVPDEAKLVGDASVWALRPLPRDPALRGARIVRVMGRLRPGVTIDAARADLAAIAAALARQYPSTNSGRTITIEPLRDAIVGRDLRVTSLLFLGVVGFVLLICCANVANLLLARATVRSRELAVRSALGATRGRVVRQLLTESLLLSCIGTVLGAVIGAVVMSIAPAIVPSGLLPNTVAIAFDTRVLAFCAATALLVGVLFGIAPAWQASRFASPQVQSTEGRTTTGTGGRLRSLLVVAEVATAVLLLFGAGLLLRTLMAIDRIDRGYRAEGVLTLVVDPLGSSYPNVTALQQFFDEVEQEIRAVAGVQDVAWTSTLPLGPSYAGPFAFEVIGDPPSAPELQPTAEYQIVSSTYFTALDVPLLEGRGFSPFDTRQTLAVCIVSEAFARHHMQGRSPIGARIALRSAGALQAEPVVREIVGVAKQIKGRPEDAEDAIQIYVPMSQQIMDDMFGVIRTDSPNSGALAGAVRAAIARIDKAQLVSVRDIRPLDDLAWDAASRHRFRAALVITFACLALILAMVGVFGTLSYTVQQRLREFGLRIALGASASTVFNLVAVSAARTVAAGVLIGLVLAAAFARLIASMLFGVEPLDSITFALVTVVLAGTAWMSITPVAWRATRVDPARALRSE